jgi:ribosomal RNA-processing protein 12
MSAPKSVANAVAYFCIYQLQKHGGPTNSTKTLHILALVRDAIPFFSQQNMKSSCECLLRLMALSNAIVTGLVMQVFTSLFSSEPVGLSSQLNAQLINALFDCQPSVKDMQTLQSWLVVMQNAYISLQRLDYQLCLSHLPRLFSTCLSCFLSPYHTIIQLASETMQVLNGDH